MRAREFVTEVASGKLSKRFQQATKGLHTYSDGERWSGDYTEYRLGLAVACANGKDPIDIDPKSWFGKNKVTIPYSKEEADMLKQAYDMIGAEYHDMNHGDLDSQELKSINTVSPVSNWMKK